MNDPAVLFNIGLGNDIAVVREIRLVYGSFKSTLPMSGIIKENRFGI